MLSITECRKCLTVCIRKAIGYANKLKIGEDAFKVYDAEMEVCDWTFYDVDYNNYDGVDCIVGAKATCTMGWVLNNSSTTVKIYVELKDSNKQTHKAWFVLNAAEKNDTEDKLEGCTITVDGSLPKTISYYMYVLK